MVFLVREFFQFFHLHSVGIVGLKGETKRIGD